MPDSSSRFLYGVLILFFLVFSDAQAWPEDPVSVHPVWTVHVGAGGSRYFLNNPETAQSKKRIFSTGFRLAVDYAVLPGWSLGVALFRNAYALPKGDPIAGENGGVGLFVNRFFRSGDRGRWYATLGLGYSGQVYEEFRYNRTNDARAMASGYYLLPGFGFRHQTGKHWGWFAEVNAGYYRWSSLTVKPDGQPEVVLKEWKMDLASAELKAGVLFAFGIHR